MASESIKILLIEDDQSYVRFIEEILKEPGRDQFESIHVNRLNAALQLLNQEVFDVVLLDLNLPDSSGFATFERLHSQFPLIPIIVLTGLDDEELGIRAVQRGGCYLNKVDAGEHLLPQAIKHAIERKRLMNNLETSHQKFYQLSAHLQHLREEERRRIAGELHDELGGILTAMKTELSFAVKSLAKRRGALLEMETSLTKLIDRGVDTVRRIASELRPSILDHLGLMPAIAWHMQEFQKRTRIQCQWKFCEGDIPLDKEREVAVFRIVQEALTNVARYAKASQVAVEVSRSEGAITVKIEDNGVGFDETKVNDPHSFGLIGMQERALFLRGQVTIKSVPQKGTTITLTIPLSEVENVQDDQGLNQTSPR